jgi:hypothetical protein
MTTYYSIDDADGNLITTGLSPRPYAHDIAQQQANRRGETVRLYASDDIDDVEDIEPATKSQANLD